MQSLLASRRPGVSQATTPRSGLVQPASGANGLRVSRLLLPADLPRSSRATLLPSPDIRKPRASIRNRLPKISEPLPDTRKHLAEIGKCPPRDHETCLPDHLHPCRICDSLRHARKRYPRRNPLHLRSDHVRERLRRGNLTYANVSDNGATSGPANSVAAARLHGDQNRELGGQLVDSSRGILSPG